MRACRWHCRCFGRMPRQWFVARADTLTWLAVEGSPRLGTFMSTIRQGTPPSTPCARRPSLRGFCRRHTARMLGGLTVMGSVVFASTGAGAQETQPNCEPGSWFCGDTQPPPRNPAPPPPPASPAPEPERPVVVVTPAPPPAVVIQPREAPAPYHYVPQPAPRKSEWGLNLHLGAASFGERNDHRSGLGLAGVGLRFRPVTQVAIEGNIDAAVGRDYSGNHRTETALSFNGLFYLSPKSIPNRRAQVYALAGFGWSAARVAFDRAEGGNEMYTYFGGQLGLGIEYRVASWFAVNADLRGLVRTRIDDGRSKNPEFVSSDGRTTNTSGAALAQAGMTFYW
jgi:hypothetical protein